MVLEPSICTSLLRSRLFLAAITVSTLTKLLSVWKAVGPLVLPTVSVKPRKLREPMSIGLLLAVRQAIPPLVD